MFAARNVELTYTDKLADLNPDTLGKYDGLMVFANHERFTSPDQEKALLDYVASGKGFIPVHCASYCFIQSQPYVDLVGAQFRSHSTGVFRVEPAAQDHPVMKGFTSFESWDETYVHHQAQREGPHGAGVPRRARRQGAVDVGARRTARGGSSTPPGATTTAPGATPASTTCSSAASAGRAARTRRSPGRTSTRRR